MFSKEFVDKTKKIKSLLKRNGEKVVIDVQIGTDQHTTVTIASSGIRTNFDIYAYSGKDQDVNSRDRSIDKVLLRHEERKAKWDGEIPALINERPMSDDSYEPAGVRVSLDDVDNFLIANKYYQQDKSTIVMEDYDDYGYEHYLNIEGTYASITFNYIYGNCDAGGDYMECRVDLKDGYQSRQDVSSITLSGNYENKLKKFMDENIKYIRNDYAYPLSKERLLLTFLPVFNQQDSFAKQFENVVFNNNRTSGTEGIEALLCGVENEKKKYERALYGDQRRKFSYFFTFEDGSEMIIDAATIEDHIKMVEDVSGKNIGDLISTEALSQPKPSFQNPEDDF